jgi:DNA-binding transcriptional LysR family regulator
MPSLENFRLTVFRAVAAHLSFRKAAEELYLTQPAVTFQIKALEEDLGVQLFDRSGQRIALTRAGELLLAASRESHERLLEAEQQISALDGQMGGELALGVSTTISQYLLARLLRGFLTEHPQARFRVVTGNTERIVQSVLDGQAALGLIEGPSRSREVSTEPFLRDELVLIVAAAHEWAEAEEVVASELVATPLLMRERGSGSRRVLELALERAGVKRKSLRVAMELDSVEAIKSAVEAGLGVGFVSRWAVARDVRLGQQFRIVPVRDLVVTRDFSSIARISPAPQGLAQEFRRFLTGTFPALSKKTDRKSAGASPLHRRS